ncbi:5-hydroxytryptamine receptor 3A-like [Hyperolius riggenbachi]|uniref:5-hydroxytryptamine receptor 3A-like n=1 Tax=Hyperolius riggenbachi TaxID=752182 RepID=UPI0035A3493E
MHTGDSGSTASFCLWYIIQAFNSYIKAALTCAFSCHSSVSPAGGPNGTIQYQQRCVFMSPARATSFRAPGPGSSVEGSKNIKADALSRSFEPKTILPQKVVLAATEIWEDGVATLGPYQRDIPEGLSDAVSDLMLGHPEPKSIDEAISLAIRIDRRLRYQRHTQGTCDCDNSSCSYGNVVKLIKDATDINVRPVKNWRTPTPVSVDMSLYTIVSLTSLQTLTTYVWFTMIWNSEFISWDPSNYCDINQVLILGNDLWVPDLYIYEMTNSENNVPVTPYFVVTNKGEITSSKPLRIASSCNLDTFKFPFDDQTCTLTFGPYVHAVDTITMAAASNSSEVYTNSMDVFVSKGDWSLLDINVHDENVTLTGVTYSAVIYQMTLRRAPIMYVINLIIPACFLVLLDIVSMFIDLGSGERLGFKVTVVLGFSVLLLILNALLPTSDTTIPVLGIFCCVCLAVMVISIIGSICTSYMLMLSETRSDVPRWIRIWIMKYLARILLFGPKSHKQNSLTKIDIGTKSKTVIKKTEKDIDIDKKRESQRDIKVPVEAKLLKKLLVEIEKIHQELILDRIRNDTKSGWGFAARVVDRLVLILYLIIVIIMMAVVIKTWTAA